jgi:hypothetical protein
MSFPDKQQGSAIKPPVSAPALNQPRRTTAFNRWPPIASPRNRDIATKMFVFGAWAALTLAALAFVHHFGDNTPYFDEWSMVPFATGQEPVTLSWLWAQDNSHRLPLARLCLVAIYRVSECDFRAAMYVNVFLLAGSALALMFTARSLRGHWSAADVFFPLLLLQWAQAQNLLSGWQIQFVLSVALSCLALIAIAKRWIYLVGCCLLLLPLCGSNGVLMVPPIACWVFYEAIRRRAFPAISLVLGSVVICVCYMLGLQRTRLPFPGVLIAAQSAAELLGSGIGTPAHAFATCIAMAYLVPTGLILLHWVRQQPDRFKALVELACIFLIGAALVTGLLSQPSINLRWWSDCQMVGMAALPLVLLTLRKPGFPVMLGVLLMLVVIGAARQRVESRYVTLVFPVWAASYLAVDRLRAARLALAGISFMVFASSVSTGWNYGSRRHQAGQSFLAAVQTEGLEKASKKASDVYWGSWDKSLLNLMKMLEKAGHPSFAKHGRESGIDRAAKP